MFRRKRLAWVGLAFSSLVLIANVASGQTAAPGGAAQPQQVNPSAAPFSQPRDWEYQGPARRPKSKQVCMDEREQKAEALIRAGIILREIARECQKRNINPSLLPAWSAFDSANGDQIQAATRLRQAALERNYPDRPNIMREFDDRLIASSGLQRMADEECNSAARLLAGIKDYNDFVRHSARTELGRVREIFPKCRTKNDRGDR